MSQPPLTLAAYYAAVDRSSLDEALSYLDPNIAFTITVPTGTMRGSGHDGIRDYLAARGDVDRRHRLLRGSRVDDLEFAYGAVVEDGITITGHFLAAAHLSADGCIDGYQVVFDPDLELLVESR